MFLLLCWVSHGFDRDGDRNRLAVLKAPDYQKKMVLEKTREKTCDAA